MDDLFTGKVILVAGGTGGLGRAIAQAFLAAGATVVATYRSTDELDALAASVPDAGPRLDGQRVDVTDEVAAMHLVASTVAKYGHIDSLVNAVGGYVGGVKLWESDGDVLDRMLTANLRSAFALCRAVVPEMIEQGHGSIVSIAAKAGVDHPAGAGAYAASKAAVLAMMDSLAADLMGTGVRSNSVLPSIIDTPANRRAMPTADFAKWPRPDQIARVVLFLCSEDAAVVHGASVPVYGHG